MKTVLKLVIAAALINAVGRGAMAQWKYFQLKDAAQELITFSSDASTEQLNAAIVQKASELNIPVGADAIDIRREGSRTSAQVAYTQPVEFFPSYVYPLKFSFAVDTI